MFFKILWTAVLFYIGSVSSQNSVGDRCVDRYTNTVGRCTAVDSCQSARDDLQYSRVQPTFCSYTFNTALVCCRDGFNILQTPPPSRPQANPTGLSVNQRVSDDRRRISEKKCEEYSAGVTQDVSFIPLLFDPEVMTVPVAKCNYDNVKLIVGGETTEVGEFPHMAAIGWPTVNGQISIRCGGSLISERFVMTAGHCLKSPTGTSLASAEPTVVRLGDQNINPKVDDGASPVEVAIKRIFKHPNYEPPKQYNDIGLLEMRSAITLDANIRPACLWSKPDFNGKTKAVATGWGVTKSGSRVSSEELQKVTLDIIDSRICDRLLRKNRNRNWMGMDRTQVCAGFLEGGKDSCQGDSGGPLQLSSADNHCIFHVVGVISFGPKCAQPDKPAIYTRVSEYLNWIESIVWPNGF